MIAVDTSSFVAYLEGDKGKDTDELELAFDRKHVVLPPVVLTELLSDGGLDRAIADLILQLPLLPLSEDFWQRAGKNRAKVLANGFRARVADALIAQACIDNNVALLTRDKDFRHFKTLCGLKLSL